MPVFEVEVEITRTATDTVIVQADDESAAKALAQEVARDVEYDTIDMTVHVCRELTSDEALEKASQVVTHD